MTADGDNWASPDTKATYPERWRVTVPKEGIELEVTTPLQDQELVTSYGPSYWEGAVDIAGHRGDTTLRGVGYLEMTGYAAPEKSILPQ